jgi:hypothetical protein
MKKLLFIFMSMYACQVMAQMTPNKRYAPAYNQETYNGMAMVEAGRSWASRPIKVKGGGKKPGIVTLTKAWNDVWKVLCGKRYSETCCQSEIHQCEGSRI